MKTKETYACVIRLKSLTRMIVIKYVFFFILAASLIGGCESPNLDSFVEATAALKTSVVIGGNIVIAPLTEQLVWSSDANSYIHPGDPKHPTAKLATDWEKREKAMDAIVVYSVSLAAIGEASADRGENARDVVAAVKELGSAIPGVSIGTSAAGDLLIMGLETIIEVKAYHDMAKAVGAANPAIETIADVLKKDFEDLAILFEASQIDKRGEVRKEIRPVQRHYDALLKAQEEQRKKVSNDVDNIELGNELARLNELIAAVEPEITSLKKKEATLETERTSGLEFYASTINVIDAWSEAHASLKEYFEDNRRPNLVLLATRAEELKELVSELKSKK
ncbi:MAG: hypothetical protein GY774_26905 [Planctomycetes bacterium]|nr:hypothetical protein [Planctomycetota bacterium]